MSVRVPLREAADSLAKASTPEPFSRSRTSNWVARGGGLPDYVQHVAHDLVEKRGMSESRAIQMAIGIVKRWARGGGNVDATTRAAAAKAVAEWERLKAGAAAKRAGGKVQSSAIEPTLDAMLALREAALGRVVVLSESLGGVDGLIALLGSAAVQEASAPSWSPTLKRTAAADTELERHDVEDGGQMCGMISRRKGYGLGAGDRWRAHSVNGSPVSEALPSKAAAVEALRKHLEDAPARVISLPAAGKFLVARPSSYGQTTYTDFPSESAARHAAGLPAQPTSPEKGVHIEGLGEMLRFDLGVLSGEDIVPLRRVQEARRRDPFDLAEDFNPGEVRGFHGRWVRGGGHVAKLTPSSLAVSRSVPRPVSKAAQRYEGGVTRASARSRARLAAMAQIKPKHLSAAIGSGEWSARAGRATAKLLEQREMDGDELVKAVKEGKALDTEHAHILRDKSGKPLKDASGRHVYNTERQALHEAILTALLRGKKSHASPEAHFTAGGPASGKGGLVKTGEAEFEKKIGKESMIKLPKDVVHIDPDIIRTMLPEYKALLKAGRGDASSLTHEEASHIAKLATKIALGRQHHVLVDSVGDSEPGKFATKIRQTQEAGYGVHVHYATTDVQTALARAKKREEETGRKVPEQYLRDSHRDVSKRFAEEISKLPGIHLRVIDTTDQPNSVIAEKMPKDDRLVIKDAVAFRRFLAKGRG